MEDIDALFERLTAAQADRRLPPVERWQPPHEGTIDIRIARDGTWYHEGGAIRRQELVRLFATVLICQNSVYYLVTPAQKLRIEVEDAPFIAEDLDARGTGPGAELLFTINTGDYVVADAEHALEVRGPPERPRPYLHVRRGLWALLARPVFYRLVDCAAEEGGPTVANSADSAGSANGVNGMMVVYSRGARFELGPAG